MMTKKKWIAPSPQTSGSLPAGNSRAITLTVLGVFLGMNAGAWGQGKFRIATTPSENVTPTPPTNCYGGYCVDDQKTYREHNGKYYLVENANGTAGSHATSASNIPLNDIDDSAFQRDVIKAEKDQRIEKAKEAAAAEASKKEAVANIGAGSDPSSEVDNADRCSYSTKASDDMKCNGTQSGLKAMTTTTTLLDQAGQAGIQTYGAMVQQQAQMEGASQADMMRSTADMTETAAWKESVMALGNVALGFSAMSMAKKHEKNSAELAAAGKKLGSEKEMIVADKGKHVVATGTQAGLAGDIAFNFKIKDAVDTDMAAAKAAGGEDAAIKARAASVLGSKGGAIARKAAAEQKSMAEDASQAGGQFMIQGLVKAASAGANFIAANGMREAADQLAAQPTPGVVIDPGAIEMPGFVPTTAVPGTSAAISGSGVNPESAAAEEGAAELDSGDLGRGFDPNSRGRGQLTGAPQSGKFSVGGGGPSGGGGPGFGGGGSTAAASGGGDDGMSGGDDAGTPENGRYTQGGGGGSYLAGGGRAGGGDSSGPDLSGLLAQFLPKKEDDLGSKNGILDFGGNGRDIATDPDASLLGRDADIFKRVSDTYRGKAEKGVVGF